MEEKAKKLNKWATDASNEYHSINSKCIYEQLPQAQKDGFEAIVTEIEKLSLSEFSVEKLAEKINEITLNIIQQTVPGMYELLHESHAWNNLDDSHKHNLKYLAQKIKDGEL